MQLATSAASYVPAERIHDRGHRVRRDEGAEKKRSSTDGFGDMGRSSAAPVYDRGWPWTIRPWLGRGAV